MMKDADTDNSGEVDFEEFVAALKIQMVTGGMLAKVVGRKLSEEELRTKLRIIFNKYDHASHSATPAVYLARSAPTELRVVHCVRAAGTTSTAAAASPPPSSGR